LTFLLESLWKALRLIASFDAEVFQVAFISLQVSTYATFFASVVGIPCGVALALKRFRGKSALQVALNTLMALPTVVVGLLFYGLLSRRGPLGDLGLLYTPTGISVGLFVLAVPTVVNLTLSAIRSLDPRLFLTCTLLGATQTQQAWMVVKEGRFAVMAGVVVAFGRVISEVGIAMMLGGNIRGYTRTMTTAIALETSKGEFELGLALGIFLLTIALVVNAALFVLQRSKS
jgi:tungstate transport system permease protein